MNDSDIVKDKRNYTVQAEHYKNGILTWEFDHISNAKKQVEKLKIEMTPNNLYSYRNIVILNNIDIKYNGIVYKFRMMDCRPENYYLLPKNGNINKLQPVLLCLNQDKKLHYSLEDQR